MKKNSFVVFFVFGLSFLGSLCFALIDTMQVTLKVQGIGIRHGTPNNLNLGNVQYSTQTQEVTGKFNDYFWIEDLMGLVTGHYTTIQCNGLYGPNGIVITGIYLMEGNLNPIKILGNTGNVLISNSMITYQSIYNPLVYIYKSTNSSNLGLANKYGDIPILKVVIPPNTTAGTYKGTITFSLYMNDN